MRCQVGLYAITFDGDDDEHIKELRNEMFESTRGLWSEWWMADDTHNEQLLVDCELSAAIFVHQGRSQEAITILCQHGFCVHRMNGVACPRDSESAKHLCNSNNTEQEDNQFDERCDDCEVIFPEGEGNYPDGGEGRRVCADCAKEGN